MQFTANNIDINHSLLGGKDTFHATQVPGWQRGPNKTKHLASLRPKVNCEITRIQHCTRKTKSCICIPKYITKK